MPNTLMSISPLINQKKNNENNNNLINSISHFSIVTASFCATSRDFE